MCKARPALIGVVLGVSVGVLIANGVGWAAANTLAQHEIAFESSVARASMKK
jgi:hypothetical protein